MLGLAAARLIKALKHFSEAVCRSSEHLSHLFYNFRHIFACPLLFYAAVNSCLNIRKISRLRRCAVGPELGPGLLWNESA